MENKGPRIKNEVGNFRKQICLTERIQYAFKICFQESICNKFLHVLS